MFADPCCNICQHYPDIPQLGMNTKKSRETGNYHSECRHFQKLAFYSTNCNLICCEEFQNHFHFLASRNSIHEQKPVRKMCHTTQTRSAKVIYQYCPVINTFFSVCFYFHNLLCTVYSVTSSTHHKCETDIYDGNIDFIGNMDH